jgi:hypothetical protein
VNLSRSFSSVSSRLSKIIAAIAIAGSALAGLLHGWQWALGFFLGATASYFNFRHLSGIVKHLGTPQSQGKISSMAWVLFRLVLLFGGAFVIIKWTRVNLYAICAGLFVPAAAVILEAILERTYAS